MTKKLPAWRMFESVEPLALELKDSRGAVIEIERYLPGAAYLTNLDSALRVVGFICEKNRDRAPLSFTESFSGFKTEVRPPACDARR